MKRKEHSAFVSTNKERCRVCYTCVRECPAKACANETAEQCSLCLKQRVEAIGRRIGSGPGGRRRI